METTVLRKEVEPLLVALGKTIRERRVALGMSQEELAERSGLHRTYISDVERGIRNLTIGALWFIAHGLGMQLREIITLIENRVENDKAQQQQQQLNMRPEPQLTMPAPPLTPNPNVESSHPTL
jgi:transcriptional regulator with XRE-family HTH domain